MLTTLHPTPERPYQAGFMPGRLAALAQRVSVTAVVPHATIPVVDRLRRRALPSLYERADGYDLHRPRFAALPGLARNRRPQAMLHGCWPLVSELADGDGFQAVMGHFLFPDGVTAAAVAERLGVPLVLVAHGSDVYRHAEHPVRRRQIAWAMDAARALIVVSRALQERLIELSLPAEQATVLPCGFDPARFAPRDRDQARAELGLAGGSWLLFVGMLRDLKRVDVILRALKELPEVRLAIVGDGPERVRLADLARRLDVARRVRFAGPQDHDRIPLWMAAADAVVLASEHEGTPTVLVEAMAMGRPVTATAVGGVPALVGDLAPLAPVGDAHALAEAIARTLAEPPEADELQGRVAHLSWTQISAMEVEILDQVIS